MQIESLFSIIIVIISVVIHEVSHGYAAHLLGDPTARLEGRLTLNPLRHLDPVGSVFLPLMLALSSSPFLFGWAKPVPYNPYNFRRGGVWGEAIVAGAGPAANLAIALFFALLIRLGELLAFSPGILGFFLLITALNVMLALFNLIPIPPLDGSKILSALLPHSLARSWDRVRMQLEYNPFLGFGVVIVFVLVLGSSFGAVVSAIARTMAGL